MKKARNLICLMLALLMVMPTVGACAKEGTEENTAADTTADTTTQAVEVETEPVNERLLISDDLPEKTFGGENFTLYLRDEGAYPDEFVAEDSGDILDNAVYERNLNISERFDINFQYNYDTTGNTTYNTSAVLSIRAGEDVNDLLALHGAFCFNYASQDLLLDWNQYMPYNDLTKPWWDAGFQENMTIAGKLFGMTGSISYNSIGGSFCLLFNKDMLDKANVAYPYDTVRDGNWTFDAFRSMCTEATQDLNGDGVQEPGVDQYGLYSSNSWMFPIGAFYMAGDRVISFDEEEGPVLSVYNEQTVTIMDALKAFYTDKGVYIPDYHGSGVPMFDEDRALFLAGTMSTLHGARNLEIELGVVPYPKFDDSVSRYYSLVDAGQNVFCVPTTAQKLEMISIITEALAAEGYKQVIPAYYEEGLQVKYARDKETAEMLDIIVETRFFDYGYFDASLNRTFSYIGRAVLFENIEFTSYCKANERATQAALDKLYKRYAE